MRKNFNTYDFLNVGFVGYLDDEDDMWARVFSPSCEERGERRMGGEENGCGRGEEGGEVGLDFEGAGHGGWVEGRTGWDGMVEELFGGNGRWRWK